MVWIALQLPVSPNMVCWKIFHLIPWVPQLETSSYCSFGHVWGHWILKTPGISSRQALICSSLGTMIPHRHANHVFEIWCFLPPTKWHMNVDGEEKSPTGQWEFDYRWRFYCQNRLCMDDSPLPCLITDYRMVYLYGEPFVVYSDRVCLKAQFPPIVFGKKWPKKCHKFWYPPTIKDLLWFP